MTAPTSTLRLFAAAAHIPTFTSRRCPQCLRLRTFSSTRPFQHSAKRKLQTATAYQPSTLEPPPPPPRNTLPLGASVEKDVGSRLDSASAGKVCEEIGKVQGKAQEHEQLPHDQKQAPAVTVEALPSTTAKTPDAKPRRFNFAARKAAIKLSPSAVSHLRSLLDSPEPKLIRVGTKNRGCSGLAYHLEYVDRPGKFDEVVEQDGVRVLIESRTLLHIIGSEMDWREDRLSARFVFRNPNITDECGCGESFSVS